MLDSHESGVVVDVWAVPSASRSGVDGEHAGALRVRTTAPPENGKANRAVAAIVAEAVGGSRGQVIAGHAARRKRVLVFGVGLADARSRLARGSPAQG
jgi:uncharacterized protein